MDKNKTHTLLEDLLVLLSGTVFVAFGIAMYAHIGLLIGGTAGLA